MKKRAKYNPSEDPVLRDFVALLKNKLGERLKSVILFGSRARGEHGKDSDYDILILVNKPNRQMEEFLSELTYQMLDKHDKVISAFLESEAEFKRDKFEPLFANIVNEGISFYGRL